MDREDSPELTLVSAFVIGAVCLCSGSCTILGIGTFTTAIVTIAEPYSVELLLLTFATVVSGIGGLTVYFLAGGADGAVQGHKPFESILYWTSAASIGGVGLALLGIAIRSFFW